MKLFKICQHVWKIILNYFSFSCIYSTIWNSFRCDLFYVIII